MSESQNDKCCCGHRRKDHRTYLYDGTNTKGSRYVCTVDRCSRWGECDLKEPEKAREQR